MGCSRCAWRACRVQRQRSTLRGNRTLAIDGRAYTRSSGFLEGLALSSRRCGLVRRGHGPSRRNVRDWAGSAGGRTQEPPLPCDGKTSLCSDAADGCPMGGAGGGPLISDGRNSDVGQPGGWCDADGRCGAICRRFTVGAILWAFLYATVGFATFAAWRRVYELSPAVAIASIVVLLAGLAGYIVWQVRRRHDEDEREPASLGA